MLHHDETENTFVPRRSDYTDISAKDYSYIKSLNQLD